MVFLETLGFWKSLLPHFQNSCLGEQKEVEEAFLRGWVLCVLLLLSVLETDPGGLPHSLPAWPSHTTPNSLGVVGNRKTQCLVTILKSCVASLAFPDCCPEEKMFGFHKPKMYRSLEGCCICRAKSSSSRFTDSKRYEKDFQSCFGWEQLTFALFL